MDKRVEITRKTLARWNSFIKMINLKEEGENYEFVAKQGQIIPENSRVFPISVPKDMGDPRCEYSNFGDEFDRPQNSVRILLLHFPTFEKV